MATHSLITLSTAGVAVPLTGGNIHSGMDITVQNVNSSGFIYIGANDGVSSSDYGYRLTPGNAWSIELNGQDNLYAVGSANDLDVAVFKASLEAGN